MSIKNTLNSFIGCKPFFIFLFPVFFVFHGYTFNYDSVPALDALVLTMEYIASAIIITAAFWLYYRNLFQAGFMALSLMACFFFFGNIQDVLKASFPGSLFSRYRFIILTGLLLLILVFVAIKRSRRYLPGLNLYFNLLFLMLIFLDAGSLLMKIPTVNRNKSFNAAAEGFISCDTCARPDIFFIVPDQYTGNKALKEVFHFDNSLFEHELEERGFHVTKNTTSNYNLTPFSMASVLNMKYISLHKGRQNFSTIGYSYGFIRNSPVIKFLQSMHYDFYNNSIFDFEGRPAHKYTAFLPYGINMITSSTLFTRLKNDLVMDVARGKFGERFRVEELYEFLHFNENILNLTDTIASKKAANPKFVYTHLVMPHYPYYFDSKGQPLPVEKLTGQTRANAQDYVEYLQYTNKKLLQLVDQILSGSSRAPIIILLADHGFRHPGEGIDRKYDFINLNAVYFPNKNYNLFYDGMSNVNQFRVIFNTYFNQHLPLLKDSTINVWD